MTNYRRYRLKGGCYFFTVALAERRSRLLTEHIQALRTAFREVKLAHPFTMEAVVILPDHLHCIWTLPEGDDEFSTRWREIKAAFLASAQDRTSFQEPRDQSGAGYLAAAVLGACDTG